MTYWEAKVSVTRVTKISAHGNTTQEAIESIKAQASCWDGYVGIEIMAIGEKKPIKYKSFMQPTKQEK